MRWCWGLVLLGALALAPSARAQDQDHEAASGLIILIEDDVHVADAWGHLLEAEGYRVATAASATESRALINHIDEVPALIVSDFNFKMLPHGNTDVP